LRGEAPPRVNAAYRVCEGRGGWISSGGSVEATGPTFARIALSVCT